MIEVFDTTAAKITLARRMLRCPDCGQPPQPWETLASARPAAMPPTSYSTPTCCRTAVKTHEQKSPARLRSAVRTHEQPRSKLTNEAIRWLGSGGTPQHRTGCLQAVAKEITQRVMGDVRPEDRPDRRGCGRPSKGDRVGLMIRVPRSLAALFAEDASQAGMSQSDRMTEILSSLYDDELACQHMKNGERIP